MLGWCVAGTGCGDQSPGAHLFPADRHLGMVRPSSSSLVIRRFAVSLVIPVIPVLAWDRLRGGVPFWIQQTINYGGIRPAYASEVLPRLVGWASWLPHFFGWPLLVVLFIGLPMLLVYDLTRGARTWPAAFDLSLIAFALGIVFLHWLLAFPFWDRYLLGWYR